MTPTDLLFQLAKKYIWWEDPQAVLRNQRRLIAQVMDIGDFDDATALLKNVGEDSFSDALVNAEPGWFSPKSWAYWHYRLHLISPPQRPPQMPRRRIAG